MFMRLLDICEGRR